MCCCHGNLCSSNAPSAYQIEQVLPDLMQCVCVVAMGTCVHRVLLASVYQIEQVLPDLMQCVCVLLPWEHVFIECS